MVASEALVDREDNNSYRAPRANVQLTDFELERRLGDGSFSQVVQAQHKASGERYAIKIVDKHLILRHKQQDAIKNERNVLDKLEYQGIVRLACTFQDACSLYFVLELCPNGELYDQIQARGSLGLEAARFYAAEIVLILEYLQQSQVMHRDLKPENLLLTADGHLKLTDFGSAASLPSGIPPDAAAAARSGTADSRGGSVLQCTTTSRLVGTADYVSPEVLRGDSGSAASDLWALGCIIFQMLTGQPPFRAASEYLTFQRIFERSLRFPEGFPEAARDVVDRLLAAEPSDRFGAGPGGLADLKAHAFFSGIDWQQLRRQRAPAFVPPSAAVPEDEALDWELTSLLRTLPVHYSYEPIAADASHMAPQPPSTAGAPVLR